MKKIQFFALGACALAGTLMSCNSGGMNSNTALKTQTDSISYAVGAQLADGLSSYLLQMGVTKDTTEVARALAAETDLSKKATLKTRLDSIVKSNNAAQIEFFKGLQSVMGRKDNDSPYSKGIAVGAQITTQMLPRMQTQVLGEGSKEKLNTSIIFEGLKTAYDKKTLKIKDATQMLQEISKKNQAAAQVKQEAELEKKFAPQKAAAEKFLVDNKTQPGIVTTASGLEYKIEKKGNGPQVKLTDKVMVNYKATFVDGKEFDKSAAPVAITPAAVIKGWQEALPLMTVGSKWTLYIPYYLAYGAAGQGEKIPPFSNLVFEVEVVSTTAQAQQPQGQGQVQQGQVQPQQ